MHRLPGRHRAVAWLALRALAALALWVAVSAPIAIAQDITLDQMGPVARQQIEALVAEKASRSPAQHKIDSGLLRTIDAERPRPLFPILHAIGRPLPDARGRLVVDIDVFATASIEPVLAGLEAAGARVIFASDRFHSIRAEIGVGALETIAAEAAVRFVYSKHDYDTDKLTTSQGDATHAAANVRATLGYTGNGQKVCAMSDGVDSLSTLKATGDLPEVEVLPGQSGSGDEGSAMLEIITDLAPGARLGFATAFNGLASFAQNILDLADPAKGGCTVIVDDISYTSESIFQDSIVAQAVNTVTAAGVAYFASAGNSGAQDSGRSGTWEGTFSASGNLTSALIPGHTLHEFSPGITQNVATSGVSRVFMQWVEPFGAASTDYDLYVLNSAATAVVGASTNTQNGTQDPYEVIVPAGGLVSGQRVVVAKTTGATDRMLWLQWYRGTLTIATSGATKGHPAAAGAFGVAATPAAVAFSGIAGSPTGPYPAAFNAGNTVELFSSDGPRRIFFDTAGNPLPGAPVGNFTASGGVVRNKPDISAADGVATSAPGFNPFFGTSAAAPHAAAVAALIRQAFPSWTVSQLRAGLVNSALDIHAAGWDRNAGYGIVMPLATLQANLAPSIAALSAFSVAPAQVNGNGNGMTDAGEDWKLDISLANSGGVTGTGIVATLVSNTPGVVVTSGPVAYPDLAVGANAANPGASPFRFSIFNPPCGTDFAFTLSVTTLQSPNAYTYPILLRAPAGPPQTFSYTGPSVAIPDGIGANQAGATVTVNLPVSGVATNIADVNVRIDGLNACAGNLAANAGIDHTYVGDLVVGVRAPDSTLVNVIDRMGGGITAGPNLCNTTLDDESGASSISDAVDANAPFSGNWVPSAPLSAFRGRNANGTWQLRATDWYSGDSGHVNRFSIVVTPFACAPAPRTMAMTATKTVTGSFNPGGTVTYTITLANTGNGVQPDNAGDEYTDVLPVQLTPVPGSSSATNGTLTIAGNTVHWNGALDAGASTVLTIVATIDPFATGQTISSQGTLAYDANHAGTNSATLLTDDPGVAGSANATAFVVSGALATLDVDRNGAYDPLTDGVLVLRHLYGQSGNALVADALGSGAQRFVPGDITTYLGALPWQLDVDGNGTHDALTDGLLILRYMRGLRGSALVTGALGANPSRTTAQIERLLQVLMP